MTDRLFRYSQTNTFMESRREYLVKYIWELERDYPTGGFRPCFAFDVGNIGHAGLKAHYEGADVTAAMDAYIEKERLDPESDDVAAGKRALDRHLIWLSESGQDRGSTFIAAEHRLFLPLGEFHGDAVTLTFEPDLLLRDRFGSLIVVDWKFPAGYDRLSSTIDTNTQGFCYTMGVGELYGELPSSFELRQTHRKPPKKPKKPTPAVQRDVQWTNRDVLARYRAQLEHVVDEMVLFHQQVEAGDLSGAWVTDHQQIFPCSAPEICCESLKYSPEQVEEFITTRFRKKEQDF